MSNLSQKDKHSPVVQTGQPTLDQTNQSQNSPRQLDQPSFKKDIEDKAPGQETRHERKKTGTR